MQYPRVWAEIDLGAIVENLRLCRRLLSPGCKVLGVVKGDAYGHGAVAVARALAAEGIEMLGVGDSHEAICLRDAGVRVPILVLGAVVDGEIPDLIRHGITPTIHSPERIADLEWAARRAENRVPVHLLVDTGMCRLGVSHAQAHAHLERIAGTTSLRLEGMGTHLASVVEDREFTNLQIARFESLIERARAASLVPPCVHMANTAALLCRRETHKDMVRVGGLLYGIAPDPAPPGMRSALSLHTQVVYLRDLPPDTPLGYGCTFRTTRSSRIATLPIGYHDGYLLRLSNRAEVIVGGRRAPVVGRVTMDYVTIDVTGISGVRIGDRVTLLGEDGSEAIDANELAGWAETIPYEIPSHLGTRVRRLYRSSVTAHAEDRLTPVEPRSRAFPGVLPSRTRGGDGYAS